ncbi:hypothetical protein BTH41_03102 [Bacillus mycoides]|nr:hypothetical protein BTH41_03102 [Bacillus mycoides]
MKTKGGLHLLSPFVLTWNGAKKALTASMQDRTLSLAQKGEVYICFFKLYL